MTECTRTTTDYWCWNECRAREWCPVTKAEAQAHQMKSGCYRPATEPAKPKVKLYHCMTTADLGYDSEELSKNDP